MKARLAAAVSAATASAALITLATATGANADSSGSQVTTYPNAFYGTAKGGTGGLILRDRAGNPTASGIGEGTRFKIEATCFRADGVELLKVVQTEPGGWGKLYEGYVRRAFANVPPSLPC
ncbi:hypothetical protein [Streptomyces violaceusniger]|uniref:SH3b domain-containing protein n=1 Tax=Streptomyces violaceusniger (strain Tu 4113) TaxID=653045 RepID=G2PHS1_STRV4|nr:hypothetical protein [Streptomyces violaceusniger]AEM88872.1 hypothetical protein Strvi_0096 [Streptomyces violaceusniger Tu 4113]